jgi:hypothetical protein
MYSTVSGEGILGEYSLEGLDVLFFSVLPAEKNKKHLQTTYIEYRPSFFVVHMPAHPAWDK